MNQDEELYIASAKIHLAAAREAFLLQCFGDHLGETENLGRGIQGREALELYLIRKHGYTLSHVESLSYEAIGKLLQQERGSWTSPAAARGAFRRAMILLDGESSRT